MRNYFQLENQQVFLKGYKYILTSNCLESSLMKNRLKLNIRIFFEKAILKIYFLEKQF